MALLCWTLMWSVPKEKQKWKLFQPQGSFLNPNKKCFLRVLSLTPTTLLSLHLLNFSSGSGSYVSLCACWSYIALTWPSMLQHVRRFSWRSPMPREGCGLASKQLCKEGNGEARLFTTLVFLLAIQQKAYFWLACYFFLKAIGTLLCLCICARIF